MRKGGENPTNPEGNASYPESFQVFWDRIKLGKYKAFLEASRLVGEPTKGVTRELFTGTLKKHPEVFDRPDTDSYFVPKNPHKLFPATGLRISNYASSQTMVWEIHTQYDEKHHKGFTPADLDFSLALFTGIENDQIRMAVRKYTFKNGENVPPGSYPNGIPLCDDFYWETPTKYPLLPDPLHPDPIMVMRRILYVMPRVELGHIEPIEASS